MNIATTAQRGWIFGLSLFVAACGGGGGGGDSGPETPPPAKSQFSIPGATVTNGNLPAASAPPLAPGVGAPGVVFGDAGDEVLITMDVTTADGSSPTAAFIKLPGSSELFRVSLGSSAKAVTTTVTIRVALAADADAQELCLGVAVADSAGNVSEPIEACIALPDNAPAGQPLVSAGKDQRVAASAAVSLTGVVELRGAQISERAWRQVSGAQVALTAEGNNASFAAPSAAQAQTLVFEFSAQSSTGLADSDRMSVLVAAAEIINQLPTVDAGADQFLDEGAQIGLTAQGSDPDGDSLSYSWTQTSGPQLSLAGSNTDTVSFTAPEVGADSAVELEVSVDDGRGGSATDAVVITVRHINKLPVLSAGDDLELAEGSLVNLIAEASDADGDSLSYSWTQTSGPAVSLSGADSANASFTAPEVAENIALGFSVSVNDGNGGSASDALLVTVLHVNKLPSVDAGNDQVVFDDVLVTLAGNASDADGDLRSVQWTQLSGPSVQLINADALIAQFQAPDVDAETELVFTLNVVGDQGEAVSDSLRVTVQDRSAVALACEAGHFCAGAAKQKITPSDLHVAGVSEARLGTDVTQRFHLGGFGFGPFEPAKSAEAVFGTDPRLCDPSGQSGTCLSNPAAERAYHCRNFAADCDEELQEHTWVRAFYLAEPGAEDAGTQLLFITLDAVGAGNIIQQDLRAAVSGATGVPAANIMIGTSHSHAGADMQGLWGGVPQSWIQETLYVAAAQAASQAFDARKRADLSYASGIDGAWNNYRRPDVRPGATADERLGVIQARDSVGEVLGTMVQYSAHPTAIGTGSGRELGRAVHADYVLGLEDAVEAATGATAIYYNGAIADASGSGPTVGADDYAQVRSRGECVAATALALLDAQQHSPCAASELDLASLQRANFSSGLNIRTIEATLPITNPLFIGVGLAGAFNRYYDFTQIPLEQIPVMGEAVREQSYNLPQLAPVAFTPVSRITLGGDEQRLEIVTLPGEATNSFGQQIRALADTDNMMLLGLTQNSLGYIIPEEEFNYLNPTGDDGFVLPFTGYEEFVSLGPLTAPLLRLQAYGPLFDVGPEDPRNLPSIAACLDDPQRSDCAVTQVLANLDFIQRAYQGQCNDAFPEEAQPFCDLLNPDTPLRGLCDAAGFGEDVCSGFGEPGPEALEVVALEAAARGCDVLDPSNCLLPFPSNHFTSAAPAGSPQHADNGGTGLRINFNPLAMPRNVAGRPIDPTEWNRNDGYSPGQLIVSYAPGIQADADGRIPGAPAITDISDSLDPASSVLVFDTVTGELHPVWAELDINAGFLLPGNGVDNPNPAAQTRAAILIRPATNFAEGRRYVVVLKDLPAKAGGTLRAQGPFAACRDGVATGLPPIDDRCVALAEQVFPVLDSAGISVQGNSGLYLAWDFTVASAENNISRLRHMRDTAFAQLGQLEDAEGNITDLGAAPSFTIDRVIPNPGRDIAKRIEGTITVPSFVVPADPAPLDNASLTLEELCTQFPQADVAGGCVDVLGIGDGGTLPPNRLFYRPDDAQNPADPLGQLYGDGLPDSVASMTTRFMCQIPPQASADNPARPGVYGHGLLDGFQAITYDNVPQFSVDHNFLFCAVDLFGFSTGDIPNVLTVLADLSNFPVIPDGSQQGLLNFMFLARALRHPEGFGAHPEFQDGNGLPLFDNVEVFYDGNSQGGITGGPVVALSKDITRGVFGVVGMNYSTLLRRSVDFEGELEPGLPPYALPLYLSYQDDLDRDIGFALMQMLWDRSENNGYAHHITDNAALKGPDNQVLLQPAFADHQVTHWSAQVMARTIGVELADLYYRLPGDGVPFTFNDKFEFFTQRDPDSDYFWNLPLVGRDAGVAYDDPDCRDNCRTARSALIEFDEGRTVSPPIGNVAPRGDDFDPHGYPRSPSFAKCQKSHFLHRQGHIIDTRNAQTVPNPASCPELPARPPQQDSDGDGVPDGRDLCSVAPPPGESVDGNGCTPSQRDSDADGVNDAEDQCPMTANGSAADADGCAPEQKDRDGDGVQDDLDLCPDEGPAGPGQGIGGDGCARDAQARAGAAVIEASWHLGASAGQFSATGAGIAGGRGYDPYQHSTAKLGSDILASMITTRALVVEGDNGKRVAIIANDLYLPNDLLRRRVLQMLAATDTERGGDLGITTENLAITVSHSHTSPFYSSPAVGTWVFQDVFDLRFYDYMARKMHDALVAAVDDLRPVTMGGAAMYSNDVRGHTYGPKVSQEQGTQNTPAGQPYDYTTRQMYVLRFDNADDGSNYANWIVLGIHPEWVWGEEIINGDLTTATMRVLDRETGAINIMSQSETGTSGPHRQNRAHDPHCLLYTSPSPRD